MRNGLRIVFVAVAVTVVSSAAFANLVADAGFEDAGSGAWTKFASHVEYKDNFDYGGFTNVYSGSESLGIIWTNPVPQWNVYAAEQEFAVIEGYTWSASAYGKAASDLNGGEMYIETIFYDATSTEVGKIKSPSITEYTEWTELQSSGVVSNTAVSANLRLVVFTSGGDSTGGAALFDSVSATAVIPEPTTFAFLGVALVGFLTFTRRLRKG